MRRAARGNNYALLPSPFISRFPLVRWKLNSPQSCHVAPTHGNTTPTCAVNPVAMATHHFFPLSLLCALSQQPSSAGSSKIIPACTSGKRRKVVTSQEPRWPSGGESRKFTSSGSLTSVLPPLKDRFSHYNAEPAVAMYNLLSILNRESHSLKAACRALADIGEGLAFLLRRRRKF